MTLADLLNTLESADMLRIIKGDEKYSSGILHYLHRRSVTRTANSMNSINLTRL